MAHDAQRSNHRAAILAIGDEITSGDRVDTNSAFLAQGLLELGIEVAFRLALPDDRHAIARAMRESGETVDLIVATGGLGPTEDDLTRYALADVLNEQLILDEDALATLKARYEKRGIEMPKRNLVQVERPSSAKMIDNRKGTAPGLRAMIESAHVFLMPGVPEEMKAMWTRSVAPAIQERLGGSATSNSRTCTTWIRCVGIAESKVGELLEDLMQRDRKPVVGTLVSDFMVNVRVRESASDADLENRVEQTAKTVESRLQPYAFGRNSDELPTIIHKYLNQMGKTLVTAESCTGGLLGYELTTVPGSSQAYLGGWVTYSNLNKTNMIGVSPEIIEDQGAVSELTAIQMAFGALETGHADLAVAITGIAGPDGGTTDKPVGTVYIALAYINENGQPRHHCRRFLLPGDRDMIRRRTALTAMAMLYLHLANNQEIPYLLCEVSPTS